MILKSKPSPHHHAPLSVERYVDDTFTIIKTAHRSSFLDHINSIDANIQFTSEDFRGDGFMPFLDTLITPKEDDRLGTSVYRKSAHTDSYLQWDSHHTIQSKYSVVGIVYHRAKAISSIPQLLQEEQHPFQALRRCKYPTWALNRVKLRSQTPAKKRNTKASTIQDRTTATTRVHTLWYHTTRG